MRWYPCLLILLTCLILQSSFKCAVGVNNTVKCISKERQALLDFKHGFKADPCRVFASWEDQEDEQSDCCNWVGVVCDGQTGHVISLNLRGCYYGNSVGLKGNINSSLIELQHLKYLDLSNNGLSQIIPSFIGSLVNLQYLNLSWNNLYGQIPRQLSNLSRLTSLDLNDNLGLSVESLGWLSQLTLLRDVNLGFVNLSKATDWLQIVTGLPFLRNLQLDHCSLSSTIPSLLSYKNSTSTLSVLNLSGNNLNDSSIFKWMSNLTGITTSLEQLDLSANDITRSIPDFIGKMHSLSYLDLSSNAIDGVVPASILNLTLLDYLDVSNNKLQEIQNWNSSENFCKLQTLNLGQNNIRSRFSIFLQGFSGCAHKSPVSLDASQNEFWGSIPNEIATFSSLKELDLSYNQLNGKISSSLRLPSSLVSLDLSSNSLKGEFSNHHLSNLSRLSALSLYGNPELVVCIPAEWVPPFQLDALYLSSCKMGPQFPKWLQTQTKLKDLFIADTGISDTIPTAFWNNLSPNLQFLDLSDNEINGGLPHLPTNFTSNFSIGGVDLSSNHLEGAIPSFLVNTAIALQINDNKFSGSIAPLCTTPKRVLGTLDVSNNFFSGKLPDCWENFEQLQALRLDNNSFTGKLPLSFGKLSELQWLSMRNNHFHGELQMLSATLTSLAVLDLENNSFTGDIPQRIWAKEIVVLNLRNNQLSGRLPSSLCNMAKLQVLDISVNQISGTIPECICHIRAMTSSSKEKNLVFFDEMIMWKRNEQSFGINLDLVRSIAISDNELEGHIPNGISCLRGLRSLDLARNKLAGPIPPKIGQLTLLEFLDLSSNNLSGQIPSSLANLNFLGTLNLSNNNLSGRIPMGTQIQGMDPTAFMGNPGLCGPPLSNCSGDPTNVPKGQSTIPEEENHEKNIHLGLYISVILGFIVGFWGVCGSLVIKRSWRHAYFRFVEDIYDIVYATVVVTTARI